MQLHGHTTRNQLVPREYFIKAILMQSTGSPNAEDHKTFKGFIKALFCTLLRLYNGCMQALLRMYAGAACSTRVLAAQIVHY